MIALLLAGAGEETPVGQLYRLGGTLLFLSTGAVLIVAAGVWLFEMWRHQARFSRIAARVGGVCLAGYLSALALSLLLTPRRTLAGNDELSFCSLDCHLHVSATSTQRRAGRLEVTLSFRSDAKQAPEFPSLLRFRLRDAAGQVYLPVEGTLAERLEAGSRVSSSLVFQVPDSAAGLVLSGYWNGWPDYLVLGPENALIQQRTGIALQIAGNGQVSLGQSRASD